MLESPLIQELVAEKAQELAAEKARRYILTFLETRFGEVPPHLAEEIESVVDDDQLTDLIRSAASYADLQAFRSAIQRG